MVFITFPKIGVWTNGSKILDVTFDFCELFKKRRRKSDFMGDTVLQIWEKYGNISFSCPVKKVISFFI